MNNDELDRQLDSVSKRSDGAAESWVTDAWLSGAVNAFLLTEAEANEVRRTAPMVGAFYVIGASKWEDLFNRVRGSF